VETERDDILIFYCQIFYLKTNVLLYIKKTTHFLCLISQAISVDVQDTDQLLMPSEKLLRY
jgi:hypothetical protein